jgi:hypothetical protein
VAWLLRPARGLLLGRQNPGVGHHQDHPDVVHQGRPDAARQAQRRDRPQEQQHLDLVQVLAPAPWPRRQERWTGAGRGRQWRECVSET